LFVQSLENTYKNKSSIYRYHLVDPYRNLGDLLDYTGNISKSILYYRRALNYSFYSFVIKVHSLLKIAQLYHIILDEKNTQAALKDAIEISKIYTGVDIPSFKILYEKVLTGLGIFNLFVKYFG
jgi:hypothetical protein